MSCNNLCEAISFSIQSLKSILYICILWLTSTNRIILWLASTNLIICIHPQRKKRVILWLKSTNLIISILPQRKKTVHLITYRQDLNFLKCLEKIRKKTNLQKRKTRRKKIRRRNQPMNPNIRWYSEIKWTWLILQTTGEILMLK